MKKIITALALLLTCFLAFFFLPKKQTADLTLKLSSFEALPGWQNANIKESFQAFQLSCKPFLRQNPEQSVGSEKIRMQVKDWRPVCHAANQLKPVTEQSARAFFKYWFKPVEFFDKKPVNGLFTGYYMPLLYGSSEQTEEFNIPIYGPPDDIVTLDLSDFDSHLKHRRLVGRVNQGKLLPYYTREEINNGAIKNHAPVLLWVNSPIDRLFLEIQGSGVVKMPDGKQIYLGYAGENGAPYTPVGKVLIERGIMTKQNASMQGIKKYLEENPQEINPVINQNKSFVFFHILNQTAALGAQGVNLTPGYSLAVDRKWIPLGVPLWLDTTHPVEDNLNQPKILQRLMIAQDTGGAIRGSVRGDVFWGTGETATYIAGNMKNPGHYWLLLPRERLKTLSKKLG